MMNEQEAKEFFNLPLPERFHRFMVEELMSEEDYQETMRKHEYNYLPILDYIKKKMPAEFYAYFNDLLTIEEKAKYAVAFKRAMLGGL